MKKIKSSLLVTIILALLSVLIYAVQLMVFDSPRDTGFYFIQDLAFLPMQIAIVTVILGRYIKNREKSERLKKISMVINAFFSEAGDDILTGLMGFSKNRDEIIKNLNFNTDWKDRQFSKTIQYIKNLDIQIVCSSERLEALKGILKSKRDFFIRMIENPNLLEHDTFTDMLLAVFHVTEELLARDAFREENTADMAHLSNDIQRAFHTLLFQWVEYLRHLHTEYPYLYSLEIRKNPFSKK